ncbi:MAG: NADH:ubiquinone reductase (Na(+)-transporting) subunit B [Crocinitomicaceae bacterium]|nr:NADH:ubiquinone reductase (Na(+)-transporting) subunit B [Flavobacteriales bacterium]NQZ37336.1 NADH:ubiquinone reductase (Na(+)-transporting) subunit B [Crocinitomicaceae bacterium]PHR22857.1 MAG: NADH:ubiquinone reductase (Na(+)-transporting) subunit B [Fluviicola sp.]
MKFLEKIVHKHEPKFAKGGKLEKWNPIFESFITLAFTPAITTKKGSHIRDGVDLKRTMMMVILALVPCLLFGIYNTGHYELVAELGDRSLPYLDQFWSKVGAGAFVVLPLVVVSYGVGLTVEFIFGFINGHSLHEGFLVSGMLIPLVMPADVPLWMVGVATVFAVVIGKEIFGGTGMNIVNVALTARAFLFFAYPTSMSGDNVWMAGKEVDGFTGSTALGDLASFTTDKMVVAGDDTIKQTGEAVLAAFENSYSMMDSFFGMIPGSVGETSVIACLAGAVLLIFTGVGSLRIMLSFAIGGFVGGLLMNALGTNPYMDLPAAHHLLIGGFAFGAVFMATDPVTASQTATGKIIYGFLGGLIAILIRVLNPAYPEGVMLSILFMNVMAPIIDHYVVQANIKRRLKRLKTA